MVAPKRISYRLKPNTDKKMLTSKSEVSISACYDTYLFYEITVEEGTNLPKSVGHFGTECNYKHPKGKVGNDLQNNQKNQGAYYAGGQNIPDLLECFHYSCFTFRFSF